MPNRPTPPRDGLRQVTERWFLVEPLLFSVWTTHELVLEPRIQTIRVGRGRIEYNPDFIRSLARPQLEAVMRCEAVRILLKHPYQRRKENPVLSYLASNMTLQEYLQLDLPLPRARDYFGTSEYDRKYFEFYYHKLLQAFPSGLGGGNGDGDTLGVGDQSGRSGEAPLALYGDALQVGDQNAEGWDADEFLQERIDGLIVEARETTSWGSVAGALRELILAGLRPALDYRAVLARFRSSVLSTRRVLTRMKPSRRYGFDYLGSRHDFTTRLLVAVDVSGSMSSQDLTRGYSVINQFFRYGVRSVDVVAFDTEIRGRPVSLTQARREVEVVGRGGTNLEPPLALIDQDRSYDGLIVFTDGYAPVPPPPSNRRTRVLWLFSSASSYRAMHEGLRALGPAVYLKET